MRPRNLAAALVTVLASTAALRAQTPRPARRIGHLHPRSVAPDHPTRVALRPLSGRPRTGIVALSSPGFVAAAPDFAAAARKYRLPTVAILKAYAQAGVLISYGPIQTLYFARAVVLADRIARGEKPAEMPIEGPDRFELTINLRTARALGLAIPQALLLRADEVIE